MAVRTFCCIPLLGSSSSFRESRSMPFCRRSLSGPQEYDPSQTSPSAASSRILRAALSRSLAEGRMAMSSLRQLYESSNSSQRFSQPIRGRFREQPDYVVLGLSWTPAPQQMKGNAYKYGVSGRKGGFPQFPCTRAIASSTHPQPSDTEQLSACSGQ